MSSKNRKIKVAKLVKSFDNNFLIEPQNEAGNSVGFTAVYVQYDNIQFKHILLLWHSEVAPTVMLIC